jgi:hypothetical protein
MLSRSFLRSTLALVGLLSVGAAAAVATSRPSAADTLPQLTKDDEIAIRGTVLTWDPASRTVVIESPERDTLSYRVLPTMTTSGDMVNKLKPDLPVDIRYYRIIDVLVAKTTPEVSAQAKALLADPAQAPGILNTNLRVKLWQVQGMVVRTDLQAKKIDIVDPNGGAIYRTPWIKSAKGQAVLAELKPGDMATLVFTERTAFEVTPVY